MSAQTTPRRRGRTRWLLVAVVVGLVAIVGGVVALEATAPQIDPTTVDVEVTDLPPVAVTEAPMCTRGRLDELTIDELRADLPPGGRVRSEQVYRCPTAWDGLTVTFVGEVVGEVLPRRGGAWVQVNDDAYALEVGPLVGHRNREGSNTGMSVWLPDGLHEQIANVGRFRVSFALPIYVHENEALDGCQAGRGVAHWRLSSMPHPYGPGVQSMHPDPRRRTRRTCRRSRHT
jgi:hypothetical protein